MTTLARRSARTTAPNDADGDRAVVRSNRASGTTGLAVRSGAAGVFSGNRVLSSVGLSVGQAEHTGERRSEPRVFPA